MDLPSDLSLFADSIAEYHRPGVYCLRLKRPDDLGEQWDRHFDTRPDWFEEFRAAERVLYVGGAADVLSRLEDHADGEVRNTVLTTVCSIQDLRNVWWAETVDQAFLDESRIAIELRNQYPECYVHQQ